jgi:hypothetical protein
MSYPIGAVMPLETCGNGVRFKPRPLEGAVVPNGAAEAMRRILIDHARRKHAQKPTRSFVLRVHE